MPRPSRIQKSIQAGIQAAPRKPRKKREVKKLPLPFYAGMPVKISSEHQFKGFKLGLISGPCKFDEGITVNLTNPKFSDIAEYVCIQIGRGDTITPIEKHGR